MLTVEHKILTAKILMNLMNNCPFITILSSNFLPTGASTIVHLQKLAALNRGIKS